MEMQRSLARERSVIMDGRDIGTVVLPEAQVKIFLTASPEDRARRRWEELRERGTEKTYEDILREVEERDYNDTHRAAAPLRPAEDAVCLDTTGCTFRQSRERILAIIRRHMEA
jgi:cytidylate kinase